MITVPTRVALALSGALAAIGCSVSAEPGFGEQCIASMATAALRNPNSPTIASNMAVQFGFAPNANPNDPDLQTKQVEFGTPDGTMHYFAIQNASWERAALIRLTPDANPTSSIFIIDRRGSLIQASRVRGPEVTPLNIRDDRVTADFRGERELWRVAGDDAVCGRP
jgi:hypothetical protein